MVQPLPGIGTIMAIAISELLLLLLSGLGRRRSIIGDTIRPPLTGLTTKLIESGSQVTGSRGGLPMVGKGYGFLVIGGMAPKD